MIRTFSHVSRLRRSVGAYEVLGLLGARGMGEIYRVRDPRLGREVAIKVLPSAFAADSTNVLYSQRHLLFLRETTLMAQAFDPDRLALAGEPFPVAEQIQTFGSPPFGFFSVSDSGVLAYQTGTATGTPQLTWLDRAGKPLTTVGAPALYGDLALSPDGRRASISLPDRGQGGTDVWLLDLERDGLPTRFMFDAATDLSALWSPDGSRVVFSSSRKGNLDLYQRASSGAGGEDVLLADDGDSFPTHWSPDGRLYTRVQGLGNDLWVLPLSGDRKPFPFLRTPANEFNGSDAIGPRNAARAR